MMQRPSMTRKLALLGTMLFLPFFVSAADDATRAKAAKMYKEYIETTTSEMRAEHIAKLQKRRRTVLCTICHGRNGLGTNPAIPNIAGQNPRYLLEQMLVYIRGPERSRDMHLMVKDLDEKEALIMAWYFSGLPPATRPGNPDSEQFKLGREVFKQVCVSCHAKDGKGEPGYARLAGQHAEYVAKMLRRYRNGDRRRRDPTMATMAKNLTDEQIISLAGYVESLK